MTLMTGDQVVLVSDRHESRLPGVTSCWFDRDAWTEPPAEELHWRARRNAVVACTGTAIRRSPLSSFASWVSGAGVLPRRHRHRRRLD
jgi:hypothetical protein